MRNISLKIASCALLLCLSWSGGAHVSVPKGWRKFEAKQYLSFYVPRSMRLTSEERCEECAWGSNFKNSRIWLFAEYTSWNEGYAPQYLAKQKEYVKEWIEIDRKKTKIQTWRGEEEAQGYTYFAEARFYKSDGKLLAHLWAHCKVRADIDVAKRIFRTVDFPE